MANSIIYKNGITPQEYLTENSRWYLDSDIKKSLQGVGTVTYTTCSYQEQNITSTPVSLGTNQDFLYLKNDTLSIDDVLISVDNQINYPVLLKPGDVFCSKLSADAQVYIKSNGKSIIEYILAT